MVCFFRVCKTANFLISFSFENKNTCKSGFVTWFILCRLPVNNFFFLKDLELVTLGYFNLSLSLNCIHRLPTNTVKAAHWYWPHRESPWGPGRWACPGVWGPSTGTWGCRCPPDSDQAYSVSRHPQSSVISTTLGIGMSIWL